MEKYNEYKDSGIEWLGNIPQNWEMKRLKDLGKAIIGLTYSPNDIVNSDEGTLVLRSSNIQNDKPSFLNNVYVNKVIPKKLQTRKGDILICTRNGSRRLIGKNILIDDQTCDVTFGAFMTVLRSNNYRFLSYFFKSILFDFQSGAFMTSTINQLTISTLNVLYTTFPPLDEQTQIANYLDAKTTTIDKKIKLLKQKIKHYKAYRKTLINKTVTKGLNDDISDWVKFRLKDLGYLYSGLSGKSGDDFNQDDNPNNKGFIPFTNIANNTYLDKKQLGTVVIEDNEKQNQVKKNDIFFLMSSEGYEDIGKSAVLIEDLKETYLNSFCKGYRLTNKNCDASFINYLLLSDIYRQQMLVEGKGFTRINLKMEKVNNFSILIPPTKKEQQQIAVYLDAKTSTIDDIINNIVTQIKTLKELRKTLINEVVTGKVKVTA